MDLVSYMFVKENGVQFYCNNFSHWMYLNYYIILFCEFVVIGLDNTASV